MKRVSATWVSAWAGSPKARRRSGNDLAAMMALAEGLVESGEARAVCVFDHANGSIANYEVTRGRTLIHWRGNRGE